MLIPNLTKENAAFARHPDPVLLTGTGTNNTPILINTDAAGNLSVRSALANIMLQGSHPGLSPDEQFVLFEYTVPIQSTATILHMAGSANGDVEFTVTQNNNILQTVRTSYIIRNVTLVLPLMFQAGDMISVLVRNITAANSINAAGMWCYVLETKIV